MTKKQEVKETIPFLKYYPYIDENGKRYFEREITFVNQYGDNSEETKSVRSYPSKFEVIKQLNDEWCRWDWFFKDETFFNNFNLWEIPFPQATKLKYGCYSYFTEEEPDKKYTYNEDTGDFTKDENGDYLVFEIELDKNTTWLELFGKTKKLLARVKDWQHHGINSYKERENGVLELFVCS
jgi:hypothetical protein